MTEYKVALELVKLALRENPGTFQTADRICELFRKCLAAVLACKPE